MKFKTKQVIKKMQEPISQMHMKTFLLPKSQYQAQRDVEKKERDKIGEKLKKKFSNEDSESDKEYTIKNPPPSLNIYKKEKDSLAPPIIRRDNLGPYDESLFDLQLII